ncbi:CDP-alcohol phosphatidyltransferase [compost metagenome]
MKKTIEDIRLLKIDALSILIYYPLVRLVYEASRRAKFITPNFVTIFGLTQFITFLAIFFISENPTFISLGLFIFAWMDVTDGFIARKCKMSSRLGAVLDIISDRVVFYLLTLSGCIYFSKFQSNHTFLLLMFIYAFSFIFLDTIHLIGSQTKKAIGIDEQEPPKTKNKWWFNQEFRFTSYIFLCLWLVFTSNTALIYLAITLVYLDYLSYLAKALRSLGRI